MKTRLRLPMSRGLRCFAVIGMISGWFAVVAGCTPPPAGAESPTATTAPGGAQLWAENCARCHNMRSPDNYSSKEWGIIMIHMRIRSNITGAEYRAIRAFLESGQ